MQPTTGAREPSRLAELRRRVRKWPDRLHHPVRSVQGGHAAETGAEADTLTNVHVGNPGPRERGGDR